MERLVIIDNQDLRNKIKLYFEEHTYEDNLFKRNHPIGTWITTNVTDMSALFMGKYDFNEDIGNWDTRNVVTMKRMFYNAYVFNQDISRWNTSNVTDMSYMFTNANAFNQPINTSADGQCWNVSRVTNMYYMFYAAKSFNQPLDRWNVSNVLDMRYMFYAASAFNQSINTWNFNQSVNFVKPFFGAVRFLNNPENYIFNMSEKIDSIIPEKFIDIRKNLITSYILKTAVSRTNIGSTRSPQNPDNLSVFNAVGDFLNKDATKEGGQKTQKRLKKRSAKMRNKFTYKHR